MTEGLENFHFPNGSDRKAIFFLLGVNSLESNNFSRFLMCANKDAPLTKITEEKLARNIHPGKIDSHAARRKRTHKYPVRLVSVSCKYPHRSTPMVPKALVSALVASKRPQS
jgi:hypothetical protein